MIKTIEFDVSKNKEVIKELTEEEYEFEVSKIIVSAEKTPEERLITMGLDYLLDIDFRLSMIELGL